MMTKQDLSLMRLSVCPPNMLPSRGRSTYHDVGISVQELDALLQTPEAALQTFQEEFGNRILSSYQDNVEKKNV